MKSLLGILIILVATSFAHANYLDPKGPIYHKEFNPLTELPSRKLKVVSFNIHFSQKIYEIYHLLGHHPDLKGADIILLQEVMGLPYKNNENAAHFLAKNLKMNYAFVPSFKRKGSHSDFGVAILSRSKLSEVEKIILPHVHFKSKSQRAVMSATVKVKGGDSLKLYSIHAETVQWTKWRRNQVRKVRDHANASSIKNIFMAGDYNSAPFWQRWYVIKDYKKDGYQYFSKGIGHTLKKGPIKMKLDLGFGRNLKLINKGKVKSKASDHYPIWFEFELI